MQAKKTTFSYISAISIRPVFINKVLMLPYLSLRFINR